MAWKKIDATIDGKEISGNINGNNLEIPFTEGLNAESVIVIDGSAIKVISITNVGDRNEILKIEVKNDEQVSRRTKGKSKQ